MNHLKNVRELRMEKVQLELQIQEMDKKLQEVQSMKSKEMEERKSSRYHWKSGKVGKLGNQSHIMSQNKGNIKLSAGKVKVKLLKEQLQELPRQPLSYKKANSSDSEKPKIRGKICGQCENKTALLVCLECGEDYCSGCFFKSHQKEALKLHRTTLLQVKPQIVSNVLDVAHQFLKEVNPYEPKGESCSTKEINKSQHKPESPLLHGSSCDEMEVSPTKTGGCTNPRDRLLSEGSFDEEASAQSFQEVLNEWRTQHHQYEKENLPAAKPDSLKECAVQTDLKIWREPLNIEFKEDSISYMEKLWLKKQRRTLPEQLQNRLPATFIPQCTTTSEMQCSQNESNEDSDDVETKVQCPALFLPMEELRIEKHETSVKIVKLDNTYEEEFEDQADIVPYKVKLANADSQQRHESCTFRDYQNALLCANAIHQLPLFTKRKADLFHHLSSNSSCEENSKGQTIQRPFTANFPLSNSVKRSSSRLSSSSPPRSATAQSLARAASEISEIEHIDVTDHNEPFSDSIADQEAFSSLEKELNILRNLADLSENLSSLTSEESSAFNNNSLNISQATLDLFKTHEKDPCGIEEQSSSEKDTEICSFLTLSESSADEGEEDFLDKQHVITLPWPKSA